MDSTAVGKSVRGPASATSGAQHAQQKRVERATTAVGDVAPQMATFMPLKSLPLCWRMVNESSSAWVGARACRRPR